MLRVISEPGPKARTSFSEKLATFFVDVGAQVAAQFHGGAGGAVDGGQGHGHLDGGDAQHQQAARPDEVSVALGDAVVDDFAVETRQVQVHHHGDGLEHQDGQHIVPVRFQVLGNQAG